MSEIPFLYPVARKNTFFALVCYKLGYTASSKMTGIDAKPLKQVSLAARPITPQIWVERASSVWNFCAHLSDVNSRGNRRWRRKMSSVFSGQVKGSPQICPLLLFTSLRWEAGSLMVSVLCSCLTPPRTQLLERSITLSTVYISIHWIAQLFSLMLVRRIVEKPLLVDRCVKTVEYVRIVKSSYYIKRYSRLDLFEPASGVIRIPQHLVYRQPGKRMSRKKVRAGHGGFLTGVLPGVDECLNNYEVEKKVELAKWHTVLKEQLDKTMPRSIADEKSTEEDITAEIDRAARLKADVLQRPAAIDEKLTVLQPGSEIESHNMSWPPSGPLNQNATENGATTSSGETSKRLVESWKSGRSSGIPLACVAGFHPG